MVCYAKIGASGCDCLIVGGGDVAERKARLLLEAGARLTVNALTFIPQFTVWANEGMLTLVEGPFDEINQRVSDAAESRRIFCNVVDAPKAASFIMPSIIDRSCRSIWGRSRAMPGNSAPE